MVKVVEVACVEAEKLSLLWGWGWKVWGDWWVCEGLMSVRRLGDGVL